MTETKQKEIINYRGIEINVSWIRKCLGNFRNNDGSPYFSPIELEKRVQKEILKKKRHIGRITGARYEKNEGYRLSFYLKEKQTYPKAFETKISDDKAILLVRKLFRHFYKVKANRCIGVRFYGNRQGGGFGWGIRLSHNPSIGLICHEVAHRNFKKHNKRMLKFMGKLINYSMKIKGVENWEKKN